MCDWCTDIYFFVVYAVVCSFYGAFIERKNCMIFMLTLCQRHGDSCDIFNPIKTNFIRNAA